MGLHTLASGQQLEVLSDTVIIVPNIVFTITLQKCCEKLVPRLLLNTNLYNLQCQWRCFTHNTHHRLHAQCMLAERNQSLYVG